MVKIPYFIIFGVITTGIQARDDQGDSHYVKNEYDLQKLFDFLSNQNKPEVAKYYREDGLSNHRDNKASSSRYNEKSRQLFDLPDKGESLQYYESRDNNEDLLNSNIVKADVQNVVRDLLSLDRNKYRILKSNDKADNAEDIVTIIDDLQTNAADEANTGKRLNVQDSLNTLNTLNTLNNKLSNNPLSKFLEKKEKVTILDQVQSLLTNAKKGVLPLIQNLIGLKLRTANNDRYDLLCTGKNCARFNGAVNIGNNRLRCRGRACAKYISNDGDLSYDPKLRTKKIKVNDELDAVILGLADVEQLLTNLDTKQHHPNKLSDNLRENLNLENLLSGKNSLDKKSNVEAIIFDLTQIEDGDDVAKQIKQLLSQNNEGSYDEIAEYDNLKQGTYDVRKLVDSELLSSKKLPLEDNTNNVFVPQWFLQELISKSHLKSPKSILPLAKQQKQRRENRVNMDIARNKKRNYPRILRRSLIDDVGVPFHLEVQGLGQVNP